jgi:hypothetical protein
MSSQPLKKVSKKQQEVNAENMSKEAYITHLERLVQLKEEQLSKYEGTGPDMLDSAVQATVWMATARTQTDGDDGADDSGSSSSSTTHVDMNAIADGKGLLLDARQLFTQSGFTTLRPLTLQLMTDPLVCSGHGSVSPQPKWQHRPYALTKKRSCGQMSNESNPVELADISAPTGGSLRWADEPCDLDLAPPTPVIDRRNASISGAGASISSARGESQSSFGGSRGGAWRGGSRASARQQSAAQTL